LTFVPGSTKNRSVRPRVLTATDTITDRENLERVLKRRLWQLLLLGRYVTLCWKQKYFVVNI